MILHVLAVAWCVLPAAADVGEDPEVRHVSRDDHGAQPELYTDLHFLDGPFDTLVAVKAADGSSLLRLTDEAVLPVLRVETKHTENVVDGPLLDLLLTVNGLDHSLLAMSRMDASLLGVATSTEENMSRCNSHTCRETCILHNSPGGFCDRHQRCRCFAGADLGT